MRIAIALVVLSGVFALLERKSVWHRERLTDFVWWFLTPLFARVAIIAAVVALAIAGFDLRSPAAPWFRNQPLTLQWLEVIVGSDLLGYWIHRTFHRETLWPIHAVHHSSTTLDWLAAARVHPLNELIARTLQLAPFAILGIDPRVVAAAVPILTLYAIFLHADLSWDFGPLRYVIASPRFHRWHHTSEQEGLDKNFAGLFPWIDLLFGTFRMPQGVQPAAFGVREAVPPTFFGQLAFPFQKNFRAGWVGIRSPGDTP